jgi:hypothetical protein
MSWFRGFIAKSGSALLYRKMAEKEAGAPAVPAKLVTCDLGAFVP